MNQKMETVMIVDMETGGPTTYTKVTRPVVLKRAPGLGRLNRAIAKASGELLAKGHDNKRFKRDYNTGLALFVCPSCNCVAAIGLGLSRGETHRSGDAFETVCNKQSK